MNTATCEAFKIPELVGHQSPASEWVISQLTVYLLLIPDMACVFL
jgi:hypothetical protein